MYEEVHVDLLIGYMRVSTVEQNLDLQRDVAKQLGVSLSTLYVDAKGQPRERAIELLGKRPSRTAAPAQQA